MEKTKFAILVNVSSEDKGSENQSKVLDCSLEADCEITTAQVLEVVLGKLREEHALDTFESISIHAIQTV